MRNPECGVRKDTPPVEFLRACYRPETSPKPSDEPTRTNLPETEQSLQHSFRIPNALASEVPTGAKECHTPNLTHI